jgi:hypothetical protein
MKVKTRDLEGVFEVYFDGTLLCVILPPRPEVGVMFFKAGFKIQRKILASSKSFHLKMSLQDMWIFFQFSLQPKRYLLVFAL